MGKYYSSILFEVVSMLQSRLVEIELKKQLCVNLATKRKQQKAIFMTLIAWYEECIKTLPNCEVHLLHFVDCTKKQ